MEDTTNTKLPFKYVIISAGCSYAIHLTHTNLIAKKFNLTTNDFLKKCEVIHIGASSSSIQYTKESIFQITKWLMNNGILNEDIFIISNLTQFGRMNFKIDDSLVKETIDVIESNKLIEDGDNFVFDFYGFKIIQYPRGYFYLNGCIYSSLVDNPSHLKKLPKSVYSSILNYYNEYYSIDTLSHMVEYINNLIQIQEFLKENKIDYRFYFMNDIFEGWYYEGEILKHEYTKNVGKFEIPNLKKYGDVSTLDNKIKDVFSKIDFDNIISYKTEKFNYGGVDEYTITKFNFTDFISTTEFKNENDYTNFNFIGQHPVLKVTKSFEENFILPELQPFLNKFIVSEVQPFLNKFI
jgi:hypothetical protein